MYLSDFPLDQSIDIERPSEVKDPVSGEVSTGYTPIGTAKVFWWIGSGGESLISERFREDADGIVIAKPGTDIQTEDRLTLSDGKKYRALYVEDVGMRGEVIQIPVANYG